MVGPGEWWVDVVTIETEKQRREFTQVMGLESEEYLTKTRSRPGLHETLGYRSLNSYVV